jgi:hypothetical protein
MELAKVVDGWLWHSGMIGNKPRLGVNCFGRFAVQMLRVIWRILLAVGCPLHSVVDFSRCHLLRRLVGLFGPFFLDLRNIG